MGVGGTLPGGLLPLATRRGSSCSGVRWVQVPASALTRRAGRLRPGRHPRPARSDPGERRFFPVPHDAPPPRCASAPRSPTPSRSRRARPWRACDVRLATGRELRALPLRAGVDTAEWACDRADVRPRVAHQRAPVLESWPGPGSSFAGAPLPRAILRLPGRYLVDGVRVERAPGRAGSRSRAWRWSTRPPARYTPVSLAGRLRERRRPCSRERAATPVGPPLRGRRRAGRGPGVVGAARACFADDEAVVREPAHARRGRHRSPPGGARDRGGRRGPAAPRGPRAGPRRGPRAAPQPRRSTSAPKGPGLLVVAEGWDPGWRAHRRRRARRPSLRVNHAALARRAARRGSTACVLRHRPPGLAPGRGPGRPGRRSASASRLARGARGTRS